jgi:hypothetical protein
VEDEKQLFLLSVTTLLCWEQKKVLVFSNKTILYYTYIHNWKRREANIIIYININIYCYICFVFSKYIYILIYIIIYFCFVFSNYEQFYIILLRLPHLLKLSWSINCFLELNRFETIEYYFVSVVILINKHHDCPILKYLRLRRRNVKNGLRTYHTFMTWWDHFEVIFPIEIFIALTILYHIQLNCGLCTLLTKLRYRSSWIRATIL